MTQLFVPILTYWRFLSPTNKVLIGPPGSELNYTLYLAEAGAMRNGLFGLSPRFGFPEGTPLFTGVADISQLFIFVYADWLGRVINPYLVVHLWHVMGVALTGAAVVRLSSHFGLTRPFSVIAGLTSQSIPIIQESGVNWETMSHIWPMLFLVTHLSRTLDTTNHKPSPSKIVILLVFSLFTYYYWLIYSVIALLVWVVAYTYRNNRKAIAAILVIAIGSSPVIVRRFSELVIQHFTLNYRIGPRSRQWTFLGIERGIDPSEWFDIESSFFLGVMLIMGVAGLFVLSIQTLRYRRFSATYILVLTTLLILSTLPQRRVSIIGIDIPTIGGVLNWSLPRFRVTARAAFLYSPLLAVGSFALVKEITTCWSRRRNSWQWVLPVAAATLIIIPFRPLRYQSQTNSDSQLFGTIQQVISQRPHGAILDLTTRVPGFKSVLKSGHPAHLREGELNPIVMSMQIDSATFAATLHSIGVTHVVTLSPDLYSGPGFPLYSPTSRVSFQDPAFTLISQHQWLPDPAEQGERFTIFVYEVIDVSRNKPFCQSCPFYIVDTDDFDLVDGNFESQQNTGKINTVSTEANPTIPMTLVATVGLADGRSGWVSVRSSVASQHFYLSANQTNLILLPISSDDSVRLEAVAFRRLTVDSIRVIPTSELARLTSIPRVDRER